jgi:hypothetical protein
LEHDYTARFLLVDYSQPEGGILRHLKRVRSNVSAGKSADGSEQTGTMGISKEIQYQATNDRRSKNFEFFWQAVALSLAAQAFLMIIALGNSTSDLGRYFSGGVSIVVSIAALSLMASQKRYQGIEARWLDYFEASEPGSAEFLHGASASARLKQLERVEECTFKCGSTPRYLIDPKKISVPRNWFSRFVTDATAMWTILMWTFIGVDIAVVLITALDRRLLH